MKKRRKEGRGRAGRREGVQPRSAVTTRRDKALQESEAKFHSLVENIAAPVGITNLTGDFTYVNKALADLTGYTVEELVGRPFVDFLHQEDREAVLKVFMKGVSTSEEAPEIEFRVKRRDGQILSLTSKPTDFEINGKTVGFLAIITDITERKRAEDALRESEDHLRRITDNMLDMVVETDLQGACKHASQSCKAVLGYDPKDLVGKSLFDFVHPEDLGAVTETIQRAISSGHLWTGGRFECRYRHADGHHVWLENLANILRNEKNQMIGSVIGSRDITERKRIEKALGESEERFREAMEATSDGLWDWNVKTGEAYYSPAYYRMLGYEPGELPGLAQTWMNLIHAEDREQVSRANQDCIENRTPNFAIEFRMRTRSGGWKWILGRGRASARDANGRAVRMIGTHEDITERKQMEEELRRYSSQLEQLVAERTRELAASKDYAENLIQTANAIVVGLDNHGNVRFFNQATERITGYTGKELEGRNWLDVIAPRDRYPEVRREFERLSAGGLPKNLENPILTKSGEERYIVWQNDEVREQGQVVGTISFGTDITERKRAEDELRATRERLEYVISSNPAVIFTAQPRADYSDYDVTYMSNTVAQMIGYQPQDFVINPEFWESRVHPDDLPRYRAELPRFWKEGHHVFEYRFLHKDGTYRWLREESRLIHDASGKPVEVIGYGTDITERRRMEEELARSQRLATIGETATMVGHDLRNPLQSIVSTVYLAKRKLESPPEPGRQPAVKPGLVDMLETIENEAEYMDKIVSDLQDYAAPLKTELKSVQMEPLVKDTLSKIRIPRNVKVSFRVSEPLPTVMIDPAVMRRVFSNLITNAIQAMPDGGELEIDMCGTDESMFIAFKDTGVGIPEENMGKLFNTFFTTKAKGQGFGLPVCKKLVEACDGRITVESKFGEGSTFTVKLPIIKP